MASVAYPLPRVRRRRSGMRWPARHGARLLALAVLVLAIAGAGTLLVRRGSPPDPQRLLAEGNAALAAGNHHAAKRNAQHAIAAEPGSSAAHLLLARADLQLDDGLAAEAALDRAVAAGASPARLHAWRAHARLLQGDRAAALAQAARMRTDPYAARIRARALAARGDRAGASAALLALVASSPRDAAAWTDLGRLRLTGGDVGGAAVASGQAVSITRTDPAALTLAGEVVRTRFGLTAALPWFAAALDRDAYYHPALIEQAATLGELGRYREMLAATRKALLSKPGSAQALYLQAVLAARAGKPALARRLLQLTGGAIDGVPGVLLLSGGLDYRRGDFDQAAAKWRRLATIQPMNMTARRLLALALLRSGDARGSLEVVRPAVLRADADAYTLRLAARALERLGDRASAAVLIDRSAGLPGDSAAFASDTSVGALAAAASNAPGDPTYQIGLIRGLIGSGDRAGAVARARGLVQASPGAPAARIALGDALFAAGRRGEAADAYARAADLAFDAPTVLRLLAALREDGRARDAAATLSLYLQQNPRSLDARRILGRWQLAAGNHAAAAATLEGVRRVAGRDAGLLADLALAYARSGDGVSALRHGRAAYTLAPMSAHAARAYAEGLAAAGDPRALQLAAKARAVAAVPAAP